MIRLLTLLAVATLSGCATTREYHAPPEPVVTVKEVKIPVPVPCPALAELGEEPPYPDTDAALLEQPDLFSRVKLLLQGRLLRMGRLARYAAAKTSC